MNTSLDSLEVLLTRLEADPSASLSARERAALFAQAAHVYASREEVSGAQRAEWEAKLFSSAQWHSSFKDQEPYADCSTWATPDAIAYFAARLAQTANPFHAARYADFLWEKSAQGRQKFDYGRRAVAAHLTCVEIYAQPKRSAAESGAVSPGQMGITLRRSPTRRNAHGGWRANLLRRNSSTR